MEIEIDKLYKLKDAASMLCVSMSTLRSWDRDGEFIAGRTIGGHRVYFGGQILDMQEKMFQKQNVGEKK